MANTAKGAELQPKRKRLDRGDRLYM